MKNILTFLFVLFTLYAQAQKPPYIDDHIRSQLSLEGYFPAGGTSYGTGLYVANTYDAIMVSFGSGPGIGVRYGTLLTKKLQFSLCAYYQHSLLSYQFKYLSGGVNRFNFNPDLRYFFNLKNKRSRFYVGAGVLISVGTTYKLKAKDPQQPPLDLNFKYKTAVGPTIEFGYELFLSTSLSLDFAFKYHYVYYTLTEAKESGTTFPVSDLNGTIYEQFINPSGQALDLVFGVKYSF